MKEGNLSAPTRHPLDWTSESFYAETALFDELERVFDLCHGCRRCVSLCQSFPSLFDLVDESPTLEVDGIDKKDYWQVVDHCYLCDLCYMTKCPYTPPHEWNIDFPHLMLRAKAVKYKNGQTKTRDKLISNTDTIGKLASIPVVVNTVNAVNNNGATRKFLSKTLGIHEDAKIPEYHAKTLRKTYKDLIGREADSTTAGEYTTGKVTLFTTCYGNYNEPQAVDDLVRVLQHNSIEVSLLNKEQCCGMPRLELGDLESVKKAKEANIPEMVRKIDAGWDIIAPVPSCVLMFKQELPLMFPDDVDVQKVKAAIYDPFEYLMLRYKEELMNTDFKQSLGKVMIHSACHQRVQNMGPKTRQLLSLVPDTEVSTVDRCSGHDGTYALKKEFHEASVKICRPVVNKVKQGEVDYYGSDCPMAGKHIENVMGTGFETVHPISMLRKAYAI
ncbi:MAG: Fe-S oxidoreductase [Proteobacteria bacterium]|nr:Fe-S oxidoreductase [Pseudomonadota bacterium]